MFNGYEFNIKKIASCGARTRDPQIKSLMLCQTELIRLWSRPQDSNLEPPDYMSVALSIPTAHISVFFTCVLVHRLQA